ncbi:MAG: hypothetical protein JSW27_06250 [Phycisphaerales bacterium]|nr:MAG: hypothetical protein JSW27_06250 [Phycisphaerales bacterium]
MKTNVRPWAILLLVASICATSVPVAFAAEGEPRPHFVWTFEDCVKPGQMEAYMKARVQDAKLCAQHKFEFAFVTCVNAFQVSTHGIFEQFAQIDGFPQKMEVWNEKTGGKSKQLEEQIAPCVSHSSGRISVFRPDLSYVPDNPAFTPDFSQPFYQMMVVYHVKPDKYEQAQAVAKRIKEVNERKQAPRGYSMYERLCGEEVPALVVVMHAKDKAAFVNLDKKMQEDPDKEIEKILTENVHLLRKIETTEGTFVPEASYVPEGTFGDN